MNSGLDFELQIAEFVKQELQHGNLGIDPAQATVRHKPEYYSRDRQKNIIFDVSVEVCRKGADTPYFIWIWECKNYTHLVPVDDVEEFDSKLSQVGVHRAKGTMITPIGFSEGAVEFAKSRGIGLWRWIRPGSWVCCMDDEDNPTEQDVIRGLTTPESDGFRYFGSFYGLTCAGIFTTEIDELIRDELRAVSTGD